MSPEGYRKEERQALVFLLAELMGLERDAHYYESIWKSFQDFEHRGAFSVTFDEARIVFRLKDDPKHLTLPRGVEFVKVCNDRYQPKRKRLAQILRRVFGPSKPPPRLAEVIPLRPMQ
jgi:hypothetical protein